MGTQNSSKTRVEPVFDLLLGMDVTGSQWLPGLLASGSRVAEVPPIPPAQLLVQGHGRTWGDKEASLPAPQLLLEYLVQNVKPAAVRASGDTGAVRSRRELLAERDAGAIQEALAALRAGQRGKRWFVLEGNSRPDALLETEELVLVIEGKRTERSATSTTKWMENRSQLLRHMDAASERYPTKRILGLLIVEGDGGAEAVSPSAYWLEESRKQHSAEMLGRSLPHRAAGEQRVFADGVLGVTTWQRICMENNISWPPA